MPLKGNAPHQRLRLLPLEPAPLPRAGPVPARGRRPDLSPLGVRAGPLAVRAPRGQHRPERRRAPIRPRRVPGRQLQGRRSPSGGTAPSYRSPTTRARRSSTSCRSRARSASRPPTSSTRTRSTPPTASSCRRTPGSSRPGGTPAGRHAAGAPAEARPRGLGLVRGHVPDEHRHVRLPRAAGAAGVAQPAGLGPPGGRASRPPTGTRSTSWPRPASRSTSISCRATVWGARSPSGASSP